MFSWSSGNKHGEKLSPLPPVCTWDLHFGGLPIDVIVDCCIGKHAVVSCFVKGIAKLACGYNNNNDDLHLYRALHEHLNLLLLSYICILSPY